MAPPAPLPKTWGEGLKAGLKFVAAAWVANYSWNQLVDVSLPLWERLSKPQQAVLRALTPGLMQIMSQAKEIAGPDGPKRSQPYLLLMALFSLLCIHRGRQQGVEERLTLIKDKQ